MVAKPAPRRRVDSRSVKMLNVRSNVEGQSSISIPKFGQRLEALRPVLNMDRWTSTNLISACQVCGLPEFCGRVRDPGECRG